MLTNQAATPDCDCRGEGEGKIKKTAKLIFSVKWEIQQNIILYEAQNTAGKKRILLLFLVKASFSCWDERSAGLYLSDRK